MSNRQSADVPVDRDASTSGVVWFLYAKELEGLVLLAQLNVRGTTVRNTLPPPLSLLGRGTSRWVF